MMKRNLQAKRRYEVHVRMNKLYPVHIIFFEVDLYGRYIAVAPGCDSEFPFSRLVRCVHDLTSTLNRAAR